MFRFSRQISLFSQIFPTKNSDGFKGTKRWVHLRHLWRAWSAQLPEEATKNIEEPNDTWLVVSTPLKNIRQIGNLPQIGMEIKNVWNHHLVILLMVQKSGVHSPVEVGSLPYHLQGELYIPRWLVGISEPSTVPFMKLIYLNGLKNQPVLTNMRKWNF